MAMRILIPLAAGAAIVAVLASSPSQGASVAMPVPKTIIPASGPREVAYFAGGCFWGVEGVFEHVRGVQSAVSGYAGGATAKPTYDSVSAGSTGHAEVVRVTFDPRVVRYADLMRIYFSVITDPTQLNRQGPDTGTQYRTSLFPTSAAQATQARAYIAQLTAARAYPRPIVTRIEKLGVFHPAEAYHQDFMAKNPRHPYILAHDRPKVAALRTTFPLSYR
ncbi:peptide-methionine (S)-S-oxide reductase MsrA [Sphingomonas sp. LY29]|uniref:peptide-methionine (S)-S-oxide reductase MsrA n=1 Tax=Sphingomonas sp. LY29 TaxID=3095341 RepID=UPI002D76CA09|nr:peptide-methionine (S)-S-oxide reductase MsrA [Sphingomonas sp. LY29]WRP24902.1 peptide-methionine (S)-S-oxide reductase MsrA [Sphingomonas sp. LY29]